MSAENPIVQPQDITNEHQHTCMRCKVPMNYLGRRAFHEPSMWANSFFRELCSAEKFDVYFCTQCGSISLFAIRRQV